MRSQVDARKFISLVAPPQKVNVVGNIKFDQILFQEQDVDKKQMEVLYRLTSNRKTIVAGSTHPGEEEMISRTYKKLTSTYSDLLLIIAPRHLNHLHELERNLNQLDLTFIRRSRLNENMAKFESQIIILDSLGELSQIYSLADLAFVGGSLIPKGGHNLLEPAKFGIPVLFGPYVDNFQEVANLLKSSEGGIQVKDQAELYLKMDELLLDENKRKSLGQKAKGAISQQGGAAEKTAQILSKVW